MCIDERNSDFLYLYDLFSFLGMVEYDTKVLLYIFETPCIISIKFNI